jgi:hypothetical protein
VSDDATDRKFEIFPPRHGHGRASPVMPDMVVPVPPEGSSIINRFKWRIARKNMEEYTKMIRAVQEGVVALSALRQAEINYKAVIELLEDSEEVHGAARAKRKIDYINAKDDLEEAKLRSLEKAAERERRMYKLKNKEEEESKPQKPWEKRKAKLEKLIEGERELRAWYDHLRESEISKAGGEDKLSDIQKKRLDNIEMYLKDEIRNMRSEMR